MAARAKTKNKAGAKARTSLKGRTGGGRAAAKGKSKAAAPRKPSSGGNGKWSADVTQKSDALDLAPGVFKQRSARRVALALKNSAEKSRRRKSTPFRSAMSMLNFEMNRAGKGLSATRRRVLEQAKVELRRVFHRTPT
jgi:hypothetical protein